jgi:hypothetical protein
MDIVPSQGLYMMGMPYGHGQRLQSWALTDPRNCTCYRRVVFCGYKGESESERQEQQDLEKQEGNPSVASASSLETNLPNTRPYPVIH